MRRTVVSPRLPLIDWRGTAFEGWLAQMTDLLQSAPCELTLNEARAVATQALQATGRLRESTGALLTSEWVRFARFALRLERVSRVADVTPALVRAYIHALTPRGAPPSRSTQHKRRSAVRRLYRVLRELGLFHGDPTLDLDLPGREYPDFRALTDDEVERCRWTALESLKRETRRPALWALAETGAWVPEMSSVTVGDIDVTGGRVWLSGGAKQSPRWAELTGWGLAQVTRRIKSLNGPSGALLAAKPSASAQNRRTSTAQALRGVLRGAALGDDRLVQLKSITAWAGNRVLARAGRIEAVALALGLRSLDQAAELIGFDWEQA